MIATTIEQSKHLIDRGVDINTADMHYSTWTIIDGEWILSPNYNYTIEELQEEYGNQIIPAWSLSALLELTPPVEITQNVDKSWNVASFTDENKFFPTHEIENVPNLIDAVFDMIVWLKEHKKI